ncbi:MAG: periplasmic heavy metal sensor [Candidatus Cloacimonetes bacterium]|nr:periplasmic heavy metal sensor [Candidatus Cloacimonadota bacterium]
MNRKLMLALIAISLVFNFAFLGGFVYHRWLARPMSSPIRAFDASRREELRLRIESLHEQSRACRWEYFRARRDFIEALHSPAFNAEMAEKRLDDSVQRHMEMERQIGRLLIELRQDMTPIEAERFFEHLLRQQHMNGGPHETNPDNPRHPGAPDPRRPFRRRLGQP